MLPSERLIYTPMPTRPKLPLPGGKRLLVWLLISIEEWDPRAPMPRTVNSPPSGGTPTPDIPNWSWHEYGNRVGFWRLLDALDRFGLRASMAVNGVALPTYAPICEAALARNWELIGHGYVQKSLQKVDDERAAIEATTAALKAFTGVAPKGWVGPGLAETWETPDLLAEAGYRYVCDWIHDDQPTWLKTRTTPLASMPFTQECNDIPVILSQHHPAAEYRNRVIDQFDELYAEGGDSARIMAVVMHPFIMGVPHRIKYLRQALAHIASRPDAAVVTAGEIYDWFVEASPPAG